MDNKPRLIHGENKVTMSFERPPTQEEFDYWARILNDAIEHANKETGADVHIIGWESQKES